VKSACGGVAGAVEAVVGPEVWMREETLFEKECLVVRRSLVVIDRGLPPPCAFRLFSSFNKDSERSALCIGRLLLVNIGRGGEVCWLVEVVVQDVYGTVTRGEDAFRGPRLSLGRWSWGLLIRRVMSVKARRADEILPASTSGPEGGEYLGMC
jgi:hypothetical protein